MLPNDKPILDALLVLRVAATIAVVLGHSAAAFSGLSFTQWPNAPYLQSAAVVIFFCVSGATIAWVIATREQSIWQFIFDRYMRLVIPLVPALLIVAIAEFFVFQGDRPYASNTTIVQWWGSLLFLQDMQLTIPLVGTFDPGLKPFGTMRPLWTISIEFWTYIAFAGFVFACRPRSARVVYSALGVLAVCILGRHLIAGHGHGLPLVWCFGAITFFALRQTPKLDRISLICLLPLWAMIAYALSMRALWPDGGTYSSTYHILLFLAFVLAMLMLTNLSMSARAMSLCTFMGSFAYTAYLVHYPLLLMMRELNVLPPGALSVLFATVFSMAVAWLLSLPFEQRYRQIRDAVWRRVSEIGNAKKASSSA